MINNIPVMEIFGPTIQGEGAKVGQKTMFVRTGGCDYRCSWCDSAFTWDGSEKSEIMSAKQIWEKMCFISNGLENFSYITISGGNPALIGKGMFDLIQLAKRSNVKVGLETQGSKWQDWMLEIDDLVISPKPPSSGMKTDFSMLLSIINKIKDSERYQKGEMNLFLKIVIFDEQDFQYSKEIHTVFSSIPMHLSIGNSDLNMSTTSIENLRSKLLDKLDWLYSLICNDPQMNNVRALPQLHTLVWGNKRGV